MRLCRENPTRDEPTRAGNRKGKSPWNKGQIGAFTHSVSSKDLMSQKRKSRDPEISRKSGESISIHS